MKYTPEIRFWNTRDRRAIVAKKKKKNGNCYEKLGTRLKGLEEWKSDSLKVGAFFYTIAY